MLLGQSVTMLKSRRNIEFVEPNQILYRESLYGHSRVARMLQAS